MASLADELIEHTDEIVQRWFVAWRASAHPHLDVAETELKNKLASQLRFIGEQVRDLAAAEITGQIWKINERLDPELRIGQNIPIEDVVQEYRLAVAVVREWIKDCRIEVPFDEYSYFYESIFELTAESVRRYAAAQAENISRERSQYLSSLMHQMRTPLSTIAVQLHGLERGDHPPDSRALDRMRRSLSHLTAVAGGILRTEKFKPEDIPVHRSRIKLAHLVDQALVEAEPDAERKGIRIEAALASDLEIEADPDLTMDALSNLVQNAVKYTPYGFVRVQATAEQSGVKVSVQDSGPGIAKERQQELFRQTVVPDRENSAGIGLTVVYRAITAQGGAVGVDSEVGQGSCFWFTLPKVR